jgi:hypothetical protein
MGFETRLDLRVSLVNTFAGCASAKVRRRTLLLVDGNPLEDISVLATDGARLAAIMIDGRFHKRPRDKKDATEDHT